MIDMTRTGQKTYRFAISGASAFSLFDVAANADRLIIDSSGDVVIGTTSNSYNKGKLTVHNTPGPPATSGTSTTNVGFMLATTTGNSQVMDMGIYNASPYGAWIQVSGAGAMETTSPLVLNPNGGNVGIGTATPGSKLEVNVSDDTFNDIDVLKFSHKAKNREGFASGALIAAEFINGKKGFYSMKDLLKF